MDVVIKLSTLLDTRCCFRHNNKILIKLNVKHFFIDVLSIDVHISLDIQALSRSQGNGFLGWIQVGSAPRCYNVCSNGGNGCHWSDKIAPGPHHLVTFSSTHTTNTVRHTRSRTPVFTQDGSDTNLVWSAIYRNECNWCRDGNWIHNMVYYHFTSVRHTLMSLLLRSSETGSSLTLIDG